MPTFTGPGFALELATSIAFSVVRVKFTQFPKAVTSTDANDALNPANYSLVGPGRNYVISCATVAGDSQSIDLTTRSPLLAGAWDLVVKNVVEDNLTALSVQTAVQFLVTQQPTQTPLAGGTANDEVSAVLRKFFNPTLKGTNWDAVLAGIAAGDKINWDNAQKAFDQLFISTASGKYLNQRTSDQGQTRPDIGMSDVLFRQLAVAVKNKKLTEEAILEVLEVFYGIDAVRASSTTDVAEPFALADGDTLSLLIDEKHSFTITFAQSHFAQISVAYAIEVAAEITRALKDAGSNAYAISYNDPLDGTNKIRLYSGSLGLTSSLRVVGGNAQTKLRFPTSLFFEPFSTTSWLWALSTSNPNNLRFTGGSWFDLDLVQPGDLVYIFGGAPFLSANIQGVFEVQDTGAFYDVSNPAAARQQWFEIVAPTNIGGSGNQTSFSSLMFFRPKKRTIYDEPRHVVVAETDGTVDIIIPATTQAVSRQPGTGAYLNVTPALDITNLVRKDGMEVDAITSTAHGLSVGDQVQIDGALPAGIAAPEYPDDPSGDFAANIAIGNTKASLMTTVSLTGTFQGMEHHVHRLRESELVVVGGQTKTGATIAGIPSPVVLEILAEAVNANGGRQQNYKWTDLVSLSFTAGPRQFGSSTGTIADAGAITNDKILMTGGTTGDDTSGTSKNSWDLITYSKSPSLALLSSGTMPATRAGHAQASLIFYELICGGWTTAGTPIATTYSFDLPTLTWTGRGNMLRARMKHQLTKYQNGTAVLALATGGQSAAAILNQCEVYEVNTNTWRQVGPMSYARYDHAAVQIPDGRIVVFGGTGYNPTQSTTPVVLNKVEIYDPKTEIWYRLDPMRTARTKPVAVYLPTRNAIYVSGGGGRAIEIFNVDTMTWTKPIEMLDYGMSGAQGGLLGVDTFTVIGGVAT